jgi:nanoRNase/pAp phosphatase (c-di-AMP/oligoRNAs hydrolase)
MSNPTRIDSLAGILKDAPDEVFIQPHNVPDPDAIASSAGLQYLLRLRGITAAIVYDKAIEKSDSIGMLDLFGIEMKLASQAATLGAEDWAVLVDGQKGAGNLTDLPTQEVAAIDHHEYRGDQGYRYQDIRPDVGACASIIASYFIECGVEPPRLLATALLFGIMKDTEGLTRGASELDIEMFYRLYRHSDISLIKQLNGSQLTFADLESYAEAFKTVEVYGNIGFMSLACPDDSLLGAASDIVLSLDTVQAVVAWSRRPNGVKFSTRSETPKIKANDMIRFILQGIGFGGGHDHMAGGFLPSEKIPEGRDLVTFIKHRAILFAEGT